MIPDERICSFHPGQVWETSKGFLWKCVSIENGQAVFRQGADGAGRIKRKPWDAVMNWVLRYDPLYPEED